MAANVRIEGEAFTDLRYHQLGALLGTNHFDALGRMAWLWHYCTQRKLYVLSETLVASVLPVENLLQAELGERVSDGIRICGTEGRIEWYEKLKKSGKKGAQKRWKGGDSHPNGVAKGTPKGSDRPTHGKCKVEVCVDPKDEVFGGKGSGERGVPEEAFELADALRAGVLSEQPDHRLARESYWTEALRNSWAVEIDRMVRLDSRAPAAARDQLHWLFSGQGGGEAQFVVESAKAWREKWDRIARRMAASPRSGGRLNGHYHHTGDEDYADGEVKL